MSEHVILEYTQDMIHYGQQFAKQLTPGDVVFLTGDLGAGKTTLVRGILTGLGYKAKVKSPTFTLVEPYQLTIGDFFHFDLYRLNQPEELEDIGIRDYVNPNNICVFEWPEKAEGLLPQPNYHIQLTIDNNKRILQTK